MPPVAADGGTRRIQVKDEQAEAATEPPSAPDASLDTPCPDQRQPQTETCNGLDDDCDGRSDETFMLDRDSKNCGTCGKRCEQADSCCDGSCVDTTASTEHCGACGRACPSGQHCGEGRCMPSSAPVAGAAGTNAVATNAGADAGRGKCVPDCTEGKTCCDGACVDLQSDVAHCGACGSVCGATQPGCCDGQCVDFMSDTTCGSCSRDCGLLGNGSITCSCVRDSTGKIGCAGPVLNLCL